MPGEYYAGAEDDVALIGGPARNPGESEDEWVERVKAWMSEQGYNSVYDAMIKTGAATQPTGVPGATPATTTVTTPVTTPPVTTSPSYAPGVGAYGLEGGEFANYLLNQTGGDMTTEGGVGSPTWMEEAYGRWPGYGTALGLYGRQYMSPYEQYQAGLGDPLSRLYDISGRMGTAGGFPQYAPGGMFSQWAPQYAQNPFAMYTLARSMMGDVMGMTPEQRGGAGMAYGGGDLGPLLEMALRQQVGKQTAGWISGQLPIAQEQWQQQYPGWVAGAGQPSFLDYVRQKYNLGQFF